MEQKRGSRQVRRTRQSLEDALIALILEKGYEAVTIQDILDRANVGRSTFYSHYQDKEELLMSRFRTLQEAFEEHARAVFERESFEQMDTEKVSNLPMMMVKYVEHEHRLFKALLGTQSHMTFQREYLLQYARPIFKRVAKVPLKAYEIEVTSQATVSSFLSVLVWWVENDMPCSAEELIQIVLRLIEPGLSDALGIPALSFFHPNI